MKKIKFIVIVVAVICLAANCAYAWGGKDSKSYARKDKAQVFKELNLTDEQKEKIEKNRSEQFEQAGVLYKSVKEEYGKLREALKDPAVTKDKVAPIVSNIKSLQAKLVDNKIEGIFSAKEILTPEQFAKFNEIMEKRKEKRQGHSKRWGDKSCQTQ